MDKILTFISYSSNETEINEIHASILPSKKQAKPTKLYASKPKLTFMPKQYIKASPKYLTGNGNKSGLIQALDRF